MYTSYLKQNTLLLDNATTQNAWGAYSLRKLRNKYTGPCIRVRRYTDNAEKDIYFDKKGNLDIAAMMKFCNYYDDLYVKIWYDQSGNARNFTQTTFNLQPQIVSSGVMRMINNQPAMFHVDAPIVMVLDSLYNLGTVYSLIGRMSFSSPISNVGTEWLGGGANMYGFYTDSNATIVAHGLNGTFWQQQNGGNITTNTPHSIMIFRENLQCTFYIDNILYGTDNAAPLINNIGNADFELQKLSGEGAGTYNFEGYMQETIIYTSNLKTDRNIIQANMDSYYQNNLYTGLISCWTFDQKNSNDATNLAHGFTSNITYESNSISKNAARFTSSSSSNIIVGTPSDYSFVQNTGIFTISFWIKTTNYTNAQYFMGSGGSSNYEKGFYIGIESSPGLLRFYAVNGAGITCIASMNNFFTNNDWVHVTIVGNGTQLLYYHNSIFQGTAGTFGTKSTGSSTGKLTIGAITNFNLGYLDGLLDEIYIWNRALTQTEITKLYNKRSS